MKKKNKFLPLMILAVLLVSCALPSVQVVFPTPADSPTSTFAATQTSAPPATPPPTASATTSPAGDVLALARLKIKHIVVIMQENRSFDSYFGTYPGADGFPRQNWPVHGLRQ